MIPDAVPRQPSKVSGFKSESVSSLTPESRPASFRNAVRHHLGNLASIPRNPQRITRNRQDAEDAVQECFLQALLHLDRFAGKSQLSTWISRIAINAALMRIRKRQKHELPLDDHFLALRTQRCFDVACDQPAPDQQLLRRELEQILDTTLAQLGPGLSRVVDLYYFEELSARECARVLGISLSNAKSRILRARLSIRSYFMVHDGKLLLQRNEKAHVMFANEQVANHKKADDRKKMQRQQSK